MRDQLSEMRMFQTVVDAQSFTAAAAELGVSQSMVSRAVVRLEQRLGTALLLRSTRRISLTDEGTIFLQGCRRILEDIGEVERSVTSDPLATGTLRINAPVLWGRETIVPLLPEFIDRNPKLEVHLSVADRQVDLIEERIDVAIRFGRLVDSSLIAKKIGEMQRTIVASPAYLAKHGRPKTPDDLLNHECLLWDEEHDNLNRWPFEVNGAMRHIKVRGRLRSNNAQALLQLAIMGVGISRMPKDRARPFFDRGELMPLLERSHRDEAIPVHAVYVKTNIAKPRVRAFVDFLTEKLDPVSFASMKTANSAGRRRAKRVAVGV